MEDKDYDLTFQILLLGYLSTGKRDLFDRHFDNMLDGSSFDQGTLYIRTKILVKDNKKIRIQFLDNYILEKFKSLAPCYLKGKDAIILVCDITNYETLERLYYWLLDVEETYPKGNIEIILIANKIDLEDERQIPQDVINDFGKENKIEVFNTSSNTGEGIQDALRYLITKLINNKKIGICE